MFDILVRPIATYACEVWGSELIKHTADAGLNYENTKKLPAEALSYNFYKQTLGLNKYTPNIITLHELGKYPTSTFIAKQVVNYYLKCQDQEQKLTADCVKEDIHHATHKPLIPTPSGLAQSLDVTYDPASTPRDLAKATRTLHKRLRQDYQNHVFAKLSLASATVDSKLSFYASIADWSQFKLEPYLMFCLPMAITRAITQLRTGCNRLPINTGRLANPPTPVDERVCHHCSEEKGNEQHFILHCPQNSEGRHKLLAFLINKQPDLMETLEERNLLKYILNPCSREQAKAVGTFIKLGLENNLIMQQNRTPPAPPVT
mgnify:CR=1 FL=1